MTSSESEGDREIEAEQERGLDVGGDTEDRGRVEERTEALHSDCEVLLRGDLTDAQKLELALNFSQYNPSSTFSFPTTIEYGKKRSFQFRYRIHGLVIQ